MKKNYVIGIAWPGRGIDYLGWVLQNTADSHITNCQSPFLPWQTSDLTSELLRNRLLRWEREREAPIVGDVAWSYAPHIPRLIEQVSENHSLRIVAISGTASEISTELAAYSGGTRGGAHFNHWSGDLPPGETRHPVLSHTFPKSAKQEPRLALLDAVNSANQLLLAAQSQFPQQVLLIDHGEIGKSEAYLQILEFTGLTAKPNASPWQAPTPPSRDTSKILRPEDPRRCAILVPYNGSIYPECESGLKELERRGFNVRRVNGYAAIDQGRNQMATDALLDGFDETIWIDSDIGFHPDDIEKLRQHPQPIVCGIYPQKGRRALAVHVLPGTKSLTFGESGGLTEILYAATGFLLVRRDAYIRIQEKLSLPVCNERFNRPMIPWFQPMSRPAEDGQWYLAEDFAFCHRARLSGMKIYADTSIRLWHIGNFRYGWEDAGVEPRRFSSFKLNLEKDS